MRMSIGNKPHLIYYSTRLEQKGKDLILTLHSKCPECRNTTKIKVKVDDLEAWLNGKFVQRAFPYLNADEREQLISGVCPTCWENMFGKVNEED